MITKEMLLGAWRLKDYYIDKEEGRIYPFGEDVDGFLLYTTDGYMSAQMMRKGRTPFDIDNMHQGTDTEYTEAASGYHAYSGRFDFDEENQVMRHYMDVSLFPNYIGQSQIRDVTLEGDQLIISNPKFANCMIWERPKNN